jgi:hypothetical protein
MPAIDERHQPNLALIEFRAADRSPEAIDNFQASEDNPIPIARGCHGASGDPMSGSRKKGNPFLQE